MSYLAVVTDDRFGSVAEELSVLQPLGVELRVASCRTAADVSEACADADAILLNLAPMNAEALAGLRRCKVVSRYGVGMDNVDQKACAARGIAVANVPGYCDEEVAAHALGLMLDLARGIAERHAAVSAGGWNVQSPQRAVNGATIGVLGFGGSGRAFCRAVMGLRPERILVWSPNISEARIRSALGPLMDATGISVQAATMAEILAWSDFISIHLKLCQDTMGLIGKAALGAVKPGVILINTSRGGIVDSAALAQAIKDGRVGGAGLDVLDQEPPLAGHPLLGLPAVILTDHCGYRSQRSIKELKTRCAENAARGLGLLP
jgi:D-3-phosphoglycerate dehydrogenase / 2-oxoglutarate reductase